MRSYSLTGGLYLRLLERAGLPKETRFHDLRHTCATLLLKRGVHPKLVQELLGHKTIYHHARHLLPRLAGHGRRRSRGDGRGPRLTDELQYGCSRPPRSDSRRLPCPSDVYLQNALFAQ